MANFGLYFVGKWVIRPQADSPLPASSNPTVAHFRLKYQFPNMLLFFYQHFAPNGAKTVPLGTKYR